MANNEMFLTEKSKKFFENLKSGITEIDDVEFIKFGNAVTVLVEGEKVFEYYTNEKKEFDYSSDDYDYNFGGPKINYVTIEHQNYYFTTGDKLTSSKRDGEETTISFIPNNMVLYENGIDYPVDSKNPKSKRIPFRIINSKFSYTGEYSDIFQMTLDRNNNIEFTIDGETSSIDYLSQGKDLVNRLINRHYDKKEDIKVVALSERIEDGLSYLETILVELINKRSKLSSRHDFTMEATMLKKRLESLKTDLNYTDTRFSREEAKVVKEAYDVLSIIKSALGYYDYYKIVGERNNNIAIEQFNDDIEKLDRQVKNGSITERRVGNKTVLSRKRNRGKDFYEACVDLGNRVPRR